MTERAALPGQVSGRHTHYDVAGPARAVSLEAAPDISAEAATDLLTIKNGPIFVCSTPDGDIDPGLPFGQGVYFRDTRHISELTLSLGGKKPLLLSASAEAGFEAFIDLTNPELGEGVGAIEHMKLNLRRRRLVDDRVYEEITIRNHSQRHIATYLELTLDADFADMFEIRGTTRRKTRGKALVPKLEDGILYFAYAGDDDVVRETSVTLGGAEEVTKGADHERVVRWKIELDPREARAVSFAIDPCGPPEPSGPRARAIAEEKVLRSRDQWRGHSTSITTPHRSFNRLVDASIRDLSILTTPIDGGNIIVAGIPWYVAPFGRDALLTSYESLLLNPGLAKDALLFLAQHQAKHDDPLRDAEPGKILHELRVGELACSGYIPHTPYYGTVDATPLFVMLAAAYHRWTDDLETMSRLKPHLDVALAWIDDHGDMDGDGFVEYERRSPAGLRNQGWKDSKDAIVDGDGKLAQGPIALVEVQAYVYLAKSRIGDTYEALGNDDRARTLRGEAETLRDAFNDAFWMPDEGTYALALDGRKRQVKSVTSNAGHCLYCAIVPDDYAAHMAERLMADDMYSGWGIRTLSSDSPAYNPMSYHNGSVWPHDNAVIAAGLKRYGFVEATEAIALALVEAAVASAEARLPELYCGFRRRPDRALVQYPVACRPQAWAAAVPFMLLQAMLGISANAHTGILSINQPQVPEWLGGLELHNLSVGSSRVSLAFGRHRERTSFSLLDNDGDIRVILEG
jgi:glycogen debranching enzyme